MTPNHARTYLIGDRHRLRSRYFAELSRADEQQSLRESEPVEHATEQWDAHMLSALCAIDERALRSIAAALDRLEHGQFGLCSRCECQITIGRLEALPSATTCIRCATFAERD